MKNQLLKILSLGSILFFLSCAGDPYHDTGLAQGVYDGNMLEYLKNYPDNWDSLVMMIQRAGLDSLFEGKNSDYTQITLFGCTNHSILKFLFENVDDEGNRIYEKINDIPVETCRRLILSYVILGRRMMDSFEYEIRTVTDDGSFLSTGGTFLKTVEGDSVRIYRMKTSYAGIPDIGPDALAFQFLKSGHIGEVASCNIQTDNGVVHSFYSDFTLTENEGIAKIETE